MKKNEKPFLFLHIPKTGGITFHAIIRKQFISEKRFTITTKKDVLKWNQLPEQEKLKYGVVKGHFWWHGTNFHTLGGTYFTFLREPEQRLISHYYHMLNRKEGKTREEFGNDFFSLSRLLQSEKFLNFDNCMVRFLSGNHDKAWNTIDESDLQLAIRNFDEHFGHFGILEKYDQSLLILSYEMGWKKPYYIRLNEGKNENTVKEDFDAETKERIQHFTRFDKILWEHGKNKFDNKILLHCDKLSGDLKKFREENKKNVFFRKLYHVVFGQSTFR